MSRFISTLALGLSGCFLQAIPQAALAASFDTSAVCSNSLAIDISPDGARLTVRCDGNLTLTGGSITASDTLVVSSTGTLTLIDITLNTGSIQLWADRFLPPSGLTLVPSSPLPTSSALTDRGWGWGWDLSATIDSGRGTDAGIVRIPGELRLGAERTVSLTNWSQPQISVISGAVPEPSSWLQLGAGLTVLAAALRRKA